MNSELIERKMELSKGQEASKVQLGWGSFLTFDFGELRLVRNHYRGTWVLWIYMCDWTVSSTTRQLADSERRRTFIREFVKGFKNRKLEDFATHERNHVSRFIFSGGLTLECKPYELNQEDPLWRLYTPDSQVIEGYPKGLRISPSHKQLLELNS